MRTEKVNFVPVFVPGMKDIAILLACGLLASCGPRSEDHWYERSSEASQNEARYISVQSSLGIPETEAKANYAGRIFAEATEGRDKKFVWDKRDMETGTPPREMPR